MDIKVLNINRGIIFALIASFLFSVMAALTKLVSVRIPSTQIVLFRSLITIVIVSYYMSVNNYSFKGKNVKILILRGLVGGVALLGYFYTIAKIKLGDASILRQISPIFVIIFAGIFLKEKIPKVFYSLLIFCLIGSVLVIKPSFTSFSSTPALIGFIASIFVGGAYVCIRFLSRDNNIYIIVLYLSLISTILCAPIVAGSFVPPTSEELIILLLVGLSSSLAQIFLTKACRLEKAGIVAMVGFTTLFFHVFWGMLFWQEFLDIYSVIGGVFILASCVALTFKNTLTVSSVKL